MDTGSTPVYSTIPCFDEHLSIKVYKTRIYLICGIRNSYEAESEKWQNTIQLSIGGVFISLYVHISCKNGEFVRLTLLQTVYHDYIIIM